MFIDGSVLACGLGRFRAWRVEQSPTSPKTFHLFGRVSSGNVLVILVLSYLLHLSLV